ncbi:putative aminophospholipid-translocase [Physocladia obscura]|uniref:P-type phospholipid transporter n=1 Tax=Physocladia obscura TaxID=109957 RepID=A0AAD5T663_9FUNG|nr:putative aminophospholipid-translocase [Physocladia obscura]
MKGNWPSISPTRYQRLHEDEVETEEERNAGTHRITSRSQTRRSHSHSLAIDNDTADMEMFPIPSAEQPTPTAALSSAGAAASTTPALRRRSASPIATPNSPSPSPSLNGKAKKQQLPLRRKNSSSNLSLWTAFRAAFIKEKVSAKPRSISLNCDSSVRYPPNVIQNQKYNVISFLPVVLYEQFKFFFNLYFLLIALSQIVPALKIGLLFSYVAPLAFVLTITLGKEAADDYERMKRDAEANSTIYQRLTRESEVSDWAKSSELCVGDLIVIEKDQRIPADCILLRTSEESGTCFIRTDQLDGETDWKMRIAVPSCQQLVSNESLLDLSASIYAEKPTKDIHTFLGNFITYPHPLSSTPLHTDPLTAENTLWNNTVLASGTAIGAIIYTGRETRAVMNTSFPTSKVGLVDLEINSLSKILAFTSLLLALLLVFLDGLKPSWYITTFRFLILFSCIIPISLRVNLDMGKTVYSSLIMHDESIPGTIVRTSTIPEELGRVGYLLTDKTGTLTRNEMELKKLHMGTMAFSGDEGMEEVKRVVGMDATDIAASVGGVGSSGVGVRGRDIGTRVRDIVTPVFSDEGEISYQASSPDEIAIVKWTSQVGLSLHKRTLTHIHLLQISAHQQHTYRILQTFPFTSESKRMGIIVREEATEDIWFLVKGADGVMGNLVRYNDWLDEECGNMAREGLRTLVVARRRLSEDEYSSFEKAYAAACVDVTASRGVRIRESMALIERDLDLLGLTGVEDKLQEDVKLTLELLRNAGLKIWMLTGDKIETAQCIAVSSKLVARNQGIHIISKLTDPIVALDELDVLRNRTDLAVIIDGESLHTLTTYHREAFIATALLLSVVICCRCSPTQKAEITNLIRATTTKGRVCAIGDGGNDVSMIQAADVGVGIVGKEGKQAIMQAVFSAIFYYAPIPLYQGLLLVGYATAYTMAPVFSLVLDRDLSEDMALLYPELYKDLRKGRSLSYKTFYMWLVISVYQGGAIMLLSLMLFENEYGVYIDMEFRSESVDNNGSVESAAKTRMSSRTATVQQQPPPPQLHASSPTPSVNANSNSNSSASSSYRGGGRGGGGGGGRGQRSNNRNNHSNHNNFRNHSQSNSERESIPQKGKWGHGPPSAPVNGVRNSNSHNHINSNSHNNQVRSSEQLDRIYFLLMHMAGTKVSVTLRQNVRYEGILHTATMPTDLGVVLSMARLIVEGKPSSDFIESLIIMPKDLVALSVANLEIDQSILVDNTNATPVNKGGFQTDSAIGSRIGEFGRERDLVQWSTDEVDKTQSIEAHGLNGAGGLAGTGEKWDQFATNKKLFGVETDFQEEIYTTVIDKSDPQFRKKEADAIRIAKEMESEFGKTDNIHLLEERNIIVHEDGVNEEDKYSSVLRKPLDKTETTYVPPAARNRNALPISGSVKLKPDIVAVLANNSAASRTAEIIVVKATTVTSSAEPESVDAKKRSKSPNNQQNQKPAVTNSVTNASTKNENIGNSAQIKFGFDRKDELLNKLPNTVKVSAAEHGSLSNQLRDPVGDTFHKFQMFAERERKQIKRPLRDAMTKPKPEMISELKAFSTSFKVPMPFPPSLKEIIKKGPTEDFSISQDTSPRVASSDGKQMLARPASYSNERSSSEIAPAGKLSLTVGASNTVSSVTSSMTVAGTGLEQQGGGGDKEKSKFKFNLSAVEFTPSFGSSSPGSQSGSLPAQEKVQRSGSIGSAPKAQIRNNSGGYGKNYQKNGYYPQQQQQQQQQQPQYRAAYNGPSYEDGSYPGPPVDPSQATYYYQIPGAPYPGPYRPMMPRPGFIPQMIMGPNGVQYMMPYPLPPGAMIPQMIAPMPPPPGVAIYRPQQQQSGQHSNPSGNKSDGPPTPTSGSAQLQASPSGGNSVPPPLPQQIYGSPQSRPPFLAQLSPEQQQQQQQQMYQAAMMGYSPHPHVPPQGFYPGHPGIIMQPWMGDPAAMHMEMQQMMVPGGPHSGIMVIHGQPPQHQQPQQILQQDLVDEQNSGEEDEENSGEADFEGDGELIEEDLEADEVDDIGEQHQA